MTKLILARHGNTFEADETPRYVGCRSNLPLTFVGEEQARCLGLALKDRHFLPIRTFSGPLERQYSTAQIALRALKAAVALKNGAVCYSANSLDPEVQKVNALAEIDLGKWEGLTKPEIEEKWANELIAWEEQFVWPQEIFGSTKAERTSGIVEFLHQQVHGCPNDQVVFAVTSNGILRLIYALYGPGAGNAEQVKRSKVATGAYCVLELSEDESSALMVQILEWNIKPEVKIAEVN